MQIKNMTKKEILRQLKDDIVSTHDMTVYLAEHNTKEYNIGKVNEELFEIGEVFNKYHNKHPDSKPDPYEIFKELIDLQFRVRVWAIQQFGEEKAKEYLDNSVVIYLYNKIQKFAGYLKKGKYKGGI
jgi:hypothetical protein